MDDRMERDIKYKNNLTAIRAMIEETPQLGPAVQGSVSPVIDLLNERFSQNNEVKGEPNSSSSCCFTG